MGQNPKANKELGQHYLKDQTVISKIMQDAPSDYDLIVEVGPGPATLTKGLNQFEKDIFLIEMDERFDDMLTPLSKVKKIFYEDALKFDWESFCKTYPGKIWMVSNLPYNISSQLFISFLKVPSIIHMTLMYQKEVGEKTTIRDSKNQMNSLLSLSLNYTTPKSLCKVPPGAFNPPPKVDSIVVSYQRKDIPLVELKDFELYEQFLRLLFSGKRKQLGRVLKPESKLITKLKDQNFDLTRRAETLEFTEVIEIFNLHRSAQ